MARNMICKTSPSIVLPLALSAIGTNPSILNPTISSSSPQRDGSLSQSHFFSSSSRQRDGSLGQSHFFSSVATDKNLVNASLYKLLKHEMKSVKFKLNNSQVNKLPDSFPYKIVDASWCNRFLVLERKFLEDDVETITVIINMRDVDTEEFDDISVSKKDIKAAAIPMIVRLRKPTTNDSLKFKIIVSTVDIIIQSFYVCGRYLDIEDDNTDFDDDLTTTYLGLEGPKFKELDNELQQCFYKFLEVRGIKSNIYSILLECIALHNNKYNLLALKDLVEVIELN